MASGKGDNDGSEPVERARGRGAHASTTSTYLCPIENRDEE